MRKQWTQKKNNTTKEKIFNTALELFAESGFIGTSIRKITRAVGIKESSLYNHYSSKDEIIRDIYGRFRTRIFAKKFSDADIDAMLDTIAPEDYFRTALDRFLAEIIDSEMMRMWKIIITEQFRDPYAGKLLHDEITDKLTGDTLRVVDRMKTRGLIKSKIDPATTAVSFIEGLKSLYYHYLSAEKTPDKQDEILELMKKHVYFFWQTIKAVQ